MSVEEHEMIDIVLNEIHIEISTKGFSKKTQALLPYLPGATKTQTDVYQPIYYAVTSNDCLPFVKALVAAGHRTD